MSYNIIEDDFQKLIEGIEFIQREYPYYDKDRLQDIYSDEQYSIQMIQKSISGGIDIDKFYKVVIFDVLIGNSDRHHSNWGIINKRETNNNFTNVLFDICPLYDNGSSL